MESGLTITRRVPSPKGGFMGVRAMRGRHGWWSGVRVEDYDAMEAECERQAIEKVLADGR